MKGLCSLLPFTENAAEEPPAPAHDAGTRRSADSRRVPTSFFLALRGGAMSSAYIKTKTKALKEALSAKDWPAVEKHAKYSPNSNHIRSLANPPTPNSDVLSFESANYNA